MRGMDWRTMQGRVSSGPAEACGKCQSNMGQEEGLGGGGPGKGGPSDWLGAQVLESWPPHPTILHLRILKWRGRTNTSKKALKARRDQDRPSVCCE